LFEPIDWKNDIKIALEKVAKNTAKSEQLLKLAYERLECRADVNLEMRLKNKKTKMRLSTRITLILLKRISD
jgi:hypothetical protein